MTDTPEALAPPPMPRQISPAGSVRRRQVDRREAMRRRLIDATLRTLVDKGYARATAVEICARAEVTRGALNHHFPSVAALMAAALDDLFDRLKTDAQSDGVDISLEDWVDRAWARASVREFKAVIEIWLAARNDPEATGELQPVIERYKALFTPAKNSRLQRILGENADAHAFYRLMLEAMIGLALGRAVTPGGRALDHEAMVLGQLKSIARDLDASASPA